MKKVLGILCLTIPLFTNAQNALPATGNVGIGTNSPQSLFHVANGDVLLQSTTSGYPILWSKSLDGSKSLRLDYNSIIISGDNGVINTTGKDLLLNGHGGANVGIGFTGTPPEKLSVNGNVFVYGGNNFLKVSDRMTMQTTSSPSNEWTRGLLSSNIRWDASVDLWKVDNGPYDDFGMVRFENNGAIGFYNRGVTNATGSTNLSDNTLKTYRKMFIDNAGNIGIGVENANGYKLAVNGNAIFTKVQVKQYPWADYVFNRDYKLLTLVEVEKFIEQNKHLPGVPSAAEIEKEGLDVGDNQATLLKKIEELTLYIIQQNKKMEQMETKINTLEKKINKP